MDDSSLIVAIQNGDIGAFEKLVKKYQSKLINFASRYVGDEAPDIAQTTFIKIYKNVAKIDPTRKFSTYLFEIAKNECFSFLRKHKREIPLTEMAQPESAPDFGIENMLEKLEEKYRNVLRMYYIEDLSYAQVAAKMAIPINTVRTYLRRAKLKLKGILRP